MMQLLKSEDGIGIYPLKNNLLDWMNGSIPIISFPLKNKKYCGFIDSIFANTSHHLSV
jgi:hypothetical protein